MERFILTLAFLAFITGSNLGCAGVQSYGYSRVQHHHCDHRPLYGDLRQMNHQRHYHHRYYPCD
ncbi:MAG: hypothetical protein RJA61_472 [Candidatus Parcubacteria bacterium]|jgi:hypothetical protein